MDGKGKWQLPVLLILAVWGCLLLSGCAGNVTEGRSISGSVRVIVAMGAKGSLPAEEETTVEVLLSGDYAAAGNCVALTVPANETDYYCYEKEIGADSDGRLLFFIPITENGNHIVTEVYDADENLIYSRTNYFSVESADDRADTLRVGFFGVEADDRLWELSFSEGDSRKTIRTVELSKEGLLSDPKAYEGFDLIVLSGSLSGELSDEQKQGMDSWLEDGGNVLIIGGEAEPAAFGFTEDPAPSRMQFAENGSVFSYAAGDGRLWRIDPLVFARNFGDRELTDLLCILFSENTSAENGSADTEEKAQLIEEMLDGQETRTVTADENVYAVIFAVYLGIFLIGGYLLLEKYKKTGWFRLWVCVGACLAAGAIWTVGRRTRFTEPYLHTLTLSEYTGVSRVDTVYAGVQSPSNQSYEFSLQKDFQVEPLADGSVWTGATRNDSDRHTALIEQTEDGLTLTMDHLTAFSSRYFCLTRETENMDFLSGGLTQIHGSLSGTLTNEIADLTDVAVWCGSQILFLPEWKKGEEFSFTEEGEAEAGGQRISYQKFMSGSMLSETGDLDGNIAWYREFFEERSGTDDQTVWVLARTEEKESIQDQTDYPETGIRFVCLHLTAWEE